MEALEVKAGALVYASPTNSFPQKRQSCMLHLAALQCEWPADKRRQRLLSDPFREMTNVIESLNRK